MQGGFDFGFGDGAFADYVPVVAVEANDGAGQDAASVACIEDQGEAVAQLFYDLSGGGAAGEAGKIGAGAGDWGANRFDDCCGDTHVGPT